MDKLKITKVDSVLIQGADRPCCFATLHLTQHHLIFTLQPESDSNPNLQDPSTSTASVSTSTSTSTSSASLNQRKIKELWIPYSLLSLVTRQPSLSPSKSKSRSIKNQQLQSSSQTKPSFPPSNNDYRDNRSNSRKSSSRILANTDAHIHSERIYPLNLKTRLFTSYTIGFKDESNANDAFETIKNCRDITSINQLYAFYYNPNPTSSSSSLSSQSNLKSHFKNPYDFKSEFTRQGIGKRTKAWRYCDLNLNYDFSPTYPSTMIIPSRISDTTLRYGSKYRSKLRLPSLSYLHWANLGSITRSSQPMVGLKQNRSIQDEKLIEAIFQSHLFSENPNGINPLDSDLNGNLNGNATGNSNSTPIYGATTTNLIIDARPTTNAVANVAKGAGTENMDHYKNCKKVYLGVENIHVMRDSLNKVIEVLNQSEKPTTFGLGYKTGEIEFTSSNPIRNNHQSSSIDLVGLKKSNWLKHISSLLEGSLLITKNIHINSSHVLIHCSDGWDRTSQLSCIAQILLDPYFRTMKGFSVLLEKDWCSFGHRFKDRCGHLGGVARFIVDSSKDDDEEEDDENEDENQLNQDKKRDIETEESNNNGGFEAQAAQAFWGFTKQLQAGFQNVSSSSNNSNSNVNPSNSSHIRETSPVFHQFLDCIFQIIEMFPNRFQFNESWLRELLKQVYGCQFGDFLFNSEKERKDEGFGSGGNSRVQSLWNEVLLSEEEIDSNFQKLKEKKDSTGNSNDIEEIGLKKESSFHPWLNSSYDPTLDDPKSSSDMGVLLPNPKQVKFWFQLFGKEDVEMNKRNSRQEKSEEEAIFAASKALKEAELLNDDGSSSIVATVEGSKDDPLIGEDVQKSNQNGGSNVPGTSPGTVRSGAVDLSTSRFDSSNLAYKPRTRPSLSSRLSAAANTATSSSPSIPPSSSTTNSSTSTLPPAPSNNSSSKSFSSNNSNFEKESNPWSTTSAPSQSSQSSQSSSSISMSQDTQDPWQAQQLAASEAANNMKKMFLGGWGRIQEAVNGVSSSPSQSSASLPSSDVNATIPRSDSTGSGFLTMQDGEPLKEQSFKNQVNQRNALGNPNSFSPSSSSNLDSMNNNNNHNSIDNSNHRGSQTLGPSNPNNIVRKSSPFEKRNEWNNDEISGQNLRHDLNGLTLENQRISPSKERAGVVKSNSEINHQISNQNQDQLQNQNQNFPSNKSNTYGYGYSNTNINRNQPSPSSFKEQINLNSDQFQNQIKSTSSGKDIEKKKEDESGGSSGKSASYDPLGVGL